MIVSSRLPATEASNGLVGVGSLFSCSFFVRHRLAVTRLSVRTGRSEATALAQHAISKRHRRTEVVDYLQRAENREGTGIRKRGRDSADLKIYSSR